MNRVFFIFCFISIWLNNVCAQKQNFYETSYSVISKQIEKQLLDKAKKGIEYTEYEEAKKNYSELLKVDSTNSKTNYAMAVTLYSNFEQPQSIPYFERTIRHSKDTILEACFFLANSYHLCGNYNKAEQTYKTYLSLLQHHPSFFSEGDMENAKNDIAHRIEMCENGKCLSLSSSEKCPLSKEGKKITISYIGDKVNTQYDDYCSVFSANDSTVFFTSKRAGDDGDIYFSRFQNNHWSPVESIGWPINTNSYEAVINITPDGKRIYFYRSGIQNGTMYYSDYINNHWNSPNPLLNKNEANTTFKETNIFDFALTSAKNELFIISDRKGGMGGKDIYVSKKMNDSTWGALENLGAPVNTQYDEVTLSLSPDGNTMYFSSNGNKSIGGFDVFVTYRKDGKWSQPINLGIPINTPGDDLFFSFLHTGNRASYSSSAYTGNSTRDLDMYYIDFCDVVTENTIKGLAIGFTTGTITATDAITKKNVAISTIKDGKYTINLKTGRRYNFIFETAGIKPIHTDVVIPEPNECKQYDIYQEITFTKPGDTLKIKSALLNIDYEKINSDITTYPALLNKQNKKILRNYAETNLLTYPAETLKTTVTTVVYDTSSGKELSKVSFDNKLLDADKNKIKEIYDKELSKIPTSLAAKSVTTFSFSNTLFDFDKSKIKESYKSELDNAIKFLTEVKPEGKIEITGYTDSKGNRKHNLILSKQRASAVAKYLISKKINKKRIIIIGYGEAKPIATNETLEGRAKNRRTEIVIK